MENINAEKGFWINKPKKFIISKEKIVITTEEKQIFGRELITASGMIMHRLFFLELTEKLFHLL